MISIFHARRILGKAGEGLSDEQIEKELHQHYAMAEMMFEHFKFDEKLNKGKLKYVQS